eukprot:scaffold1403_cov381-Prasinococcus_capsulatus_cf.AAC.10
MLRRPGPSTGSLPAATSRGAPFVAHTRWLRRPPVRASIRRPCLRHRGGKRLQATTVHVAVASVWSSPGGVAPSAWVWALVGCAAALSQALEERTAWGAGLSAPAVCIGTGLALSYLGGSGTGCCSPAVALRYCRTIPAAVWLSRGSGRLRSPAGRLSSVRAD